MDTPETMEDQCMKIRDWGRLQRLGEIGGDFRLQKTGKTIEAGGSRDWERLQ